MKRVRNAAHWGAFWASVEDGRVVAAERLADESVALPMLDAVPDIVHSPTRIAKPMVRESWLKRGHRAGGGARGREPFVAVGWDRALDLVEGELRRVKATHGNAAILGGSYGWASAGRFHHARSLLRRFLYQYGGCTDQVTNYSWGAAQIFLPHVLGDYGSVNGIVTSWQAIADHTELMVMFGGAALKNGQVSSGGFARNGYEPWLREAARAGVKFVVLSPVKDDAPEFLKAEWIPIRPNTDAALMLAMAYVLDAENLAARAEMERLCVGFARFLPYVRGATDGRPKDPRWASAITGVPAETIRDLARRIASARTMLTATWSIQRADHGEQPYWALIALAGMLGQIGLPGGGFGFGYGSINNIGNPRYRLPVPDLQQGINPLGLAFPVARIADLLLEPGGELEFNGRTMIYPDIRLVWWAGGNPFHHHQDLNRLRAAWQRPETVIVNESWWTATARHADIVLPATTTLERNDVGGSSRDRFIFAMHQAIPPVGQARNDFDIFRELASRLGFEAGYTENRDEMGWVRHLYETCRVRIQNAELAAAGFVMPPFDEFWEKGTVEIPPPKRPFVYLADFRVDPGLNRLATPSGKIEIYSETIAGFDYADCPGHPVWIEPAEWLGGAAAGRHPLHLVSNQPRTRLHSQMDQGRVSLASKVAGREPILIHPRDAAARGIRDGDVVRVFNDRGACLAGAVVGEGVMPGVVQLATGAWYDPDADGLDRHGNPNVLTLDKGTSRVGQGPSALTALVEVERLAGAAPAVESFAPPPVKAAS